MPKSNRKRKSLKLKRVESEIDTGNDGVGEYVDPLTKSIDEPIRCDVCTLPHATEDCPLINTGVRVEDALLPTKAFLTLPSSLECKECNGNKDVISKYGIVKGTQFGPLDAPKTSLLNATCPYVLKIFKGRHILHFLDTSDPYKCNWMTLVRFVEDQKARNCICYQLKNEIYFSVVEDIPPGHALVVAYSPGYSAQLEKNEQSENVLSNPQSKSKLPNIAKTSKPKSKQLIRKNFDPPYQIDKKIEHEIKIEYESSNQGHYDHDYVAPTFGDQNFKRNDETEESIVRRSKRKRKAMIIPDFDFGKQSRSVVSNTLDISSQSDEDEEGEKMADNPPALGKPTKKKGKRLYAVRALERWICKFCREPLSSIESFAKHLTEHYKKVGAARTEKVRIQKLDVDSKEQVINKELNPKVVLVRLKDISADHENKVNNCTPVSDYLELTVDGEPQKSEKSGIEVEDIKITIEPSYPYECDICVKHKIFNRAEYLIRHLRNHSGELICYDCNEKFRTKEDQKTHECSLIKGKEDEPKVCTLCDKSYCSYSNLRQHLRICHGKSFKCRTCRKIFDSDEDLKTHECKSRKNKFDKDIIIMHKCDVCDATFSKPAAFEKHLKSHDKSSFTCPVCSKILSNETLKIHIAVCEVLQKFLDRKTDDLTCPCHKCENSFGDLQDFKDHVASHTHPFMCPSCNIRLKTADEIRSHLCGKISCDSDECDKKFDSLNELKVHITEAHEGPKSYCFECAFPFVTSEGYVQHGDCELRRSNDSKERLSGKLSKCSSHKGDGLFICEVCGAFYTKWSSMKTHRYTHGPKRFFCGKCGKSFHRKELLADHVYVHEEAQFNCDTCQKKFKSKKSLEVHIRIHNNIKPYKCTTCGRTFTQKVNLRSHEMTHVPEDQKGFACPVVGCMKVFFSKEYLKFHIEAHENGKRYSCDVCDKQFVRMHMLNQHKRTAHGDHKYKCEFCIPVLFFRQKHSLFRHLKKRHQNFREIWNQEGYGEQMLIPGDGNFTHPSLKNRVTRTFHKSGRSSSSDEEIEGNIQEHADMTVMISGSMEDGTEEIEIEAQELELEEEELIKAGSTDISHHHGTSMVLLQLDNSGRYVLAFPNTIQKLERSGEDGEEEYVMEEIGSFE